MKDQFKFDPHSLFDLKDLRWWVRCKVKILIVTDASGGFGKTEGFHLGKVIEAITDDPWSHVNFEISKAHRQTSGEADVIDNIRFDSHELGQYSQIWLFGIYRAGPNALSQGELKALSQFMDGGGGVFATGDHEDLGRAMCAEVPRVRSMRRWYYQSPGPAGEPVAPGQTDNTRHDTVMDVDLASPGLQGSQSDKVPQPIRPRMYTRKTGGGIVYRIAKYPHPVLCGPDGVINYLPDHMHEGLCEVPSDVTKSFTFDGYTTKEYPTVSGIQVKPEVIAWANSRNTDGEDFGVLAAYDGHRAGIGRVLVDATWHHWFNINLTGFIEATDPGNPTYDSSVVPKWEAIKAYYRNVALWLARPTLQNCLRNGGWITILRYYDILITSRKLEQIANPLHYYWQLGVFARDALGRLASRCQQTRWIIELLQWPEWRWDPWIFDIPRPQPDPPPWLDLEQFEAVALGGAIHALVESFGEERKPAELVESSGDKIDAVARRGAAMGVRELVKRFESSAADCGRIAKLLQAVK